MKPVNLAVIIQCGGRAHRLGINEKKPLMLLPDNTRPLTNILQDIPSEIPIYLHLLREHEEPYMRFLARCRNFNHSISYLIQSEDFLYDKTGEPIAMPDGTYVTASTGPATFDKHFKNIPDYILYLDGDKVGVYFQDIFSGLEVLTQNANLDSIVFARELSDEDLANELKNKKDSKGHTRYARIKEDLQRVYEHPCMPEEIVSDKSWLALTGSYILKGKNYKEKTKDMRGELFESESLEGLFTGYSYQLKMTMALRGYNGRESGLSFKIMRPKIYIPGIKTAKNLEDYNEWVKSGMFNYRNKLEFFKRIKMDNLGKVA